MQIGPHLIDNQLIVAPMAGVTDRPFRQLCKRLGAAMAVSEMLSCRPDLRATPKSRRRADHTGEVAPISVQIAGADPAMMADAARYNVDLGAQIIDINMGCPAKKVCNVMAGSALLRDETLVGRILEAVVNAVQVPVTLKMRTGWEPRRRNAVAVARIAEGSGVRALAIHGRTRACGFAGSAEYDTIAEVKSRTQLPVIANGDIATPEQAGEVLRRTGADAIMIGRAAQGRPWIFREIAYYLATGRRLAPMATAQVGALLYEHVQGLHAFYGDVAGVRIARKHVAWYTRALPGASAWRRRFNLVESSQAQLAEVKRCFEELAALDPQPGAFEEELAA